MQTLMAVLADGAEEVAGKSSVIGIFQAVTARRFPTTVSGVLALRFSFDDPDDDDREGVVLELGAAAGHRRPPSRRNPYDVR